MEFAETFFKLKVAYDGLQELEDQPETPQDDEEEQQPHHVSLAQRIVDALQGRQRSAQAADQGDFYADLR
jgi:hypothetical protein